MIAFFLPPRLPPPPPPQVRERLRPAMRRRVRLGLGINNSKLCGCALIDIVDYDEYLAAFAPLWPSVRLGCYCMWHARRCRCTLVSLVLWQPAGLAAKMSCLPTGRSRPEGSLPPVRALVRRFPAD